MSRPLQALLVGVLAVMFAGAGFLFYQWRSGTLGGESDASTAGQVLLAATLKGLDDKPQPLEQWRGSVVVVNFWATWCAPCREEIPVFIQFQRQYASRGVQFLGIAIDQKERVGPYAKDIGINYPVLVGGMETMDLARKVGNRAGVLPFTVVINREGKVVSTVAGILKPEKLETLLKRLL